MSFFSGWHCKVHCSEKFEACSEITMKTTIPACTLEHGWPLPPLSHGRDLHLPSCLCTTSFTPQCLLVNNFLFPLLFSGQQHFRHTETTYYVIQRGGNTAVHISYIMLYCSSHSLQRKMGSSLELLWCKEGARGPDNTPLICLLLSGHFKHPRCLRRAAGVCIHSDTEAAAEHTRHMIGIVSRLQPSATFLRPPLELARSRIYQTPQAAGWMDGLCLKWNLCQQKCSQSESKGCGIWIGRECRSSSVFAWNFQTPFLFRLHKLQTDKLLATTTIILLLLWMVQLTTY